MEDFDMFKGLPEKTYFPIVWFESKYQVPDSLASSVSLNRNALPKT